MQQHVRFDYAIGDVQGCFDDLKRLLNHIKFDDKADRLWFVGDLVNRGPESLEVLRFIKKLHIKPRITLGNHDLHLLSLLYTNKKSNDQEDTLEKILEAPDRYELGDWLRKQSILYYDADLNIAMCHAGIAPMWSLSEAMSLALELENTLAGDDFCKFLENMYGNKPEKWSKNLSGISRLRVICNYFTRMRFCYEDGKLALQYKGNIQRAPNGLYPWYSVPNRINCATDIVFGHWAALDGVCPNSSIHAIDTGCVWGRKMTALRLQDKHRMTIVSMVS